MATHIFPTVNDVNAGTSGMGKTITEANMRKLMSVPYHGKPYVKSGAAGSNAGSLNLNVAAGVYCIEGMYVEKDATETVALTASSTCRVWLQLVKDGSGNVTGTQWVVATSATVPSGEEAVLTQIVVTGASTITTIYDSFRGIIAPGAILDEDINTTNMSGSGDHFSLSNIVGDGLTEIEASCSAISFGSSGAAGTNIYADLRDAASAGGNQLGSTQAHMAGASYQHPFTMRSRLTADASVKSYYINLQNSSGTPTIYGASGYPAIFQLAWRI